MSPSCQIDVTFGQSGVYYYGAIPSYKGRTAASTAGGQYDGRPSYHPTAFVVPNANGSVSGSVPPGFAGTVYTTRPIPGDVQPSIIHDTITVFSGGRVNIPLQDQTSIPNQPQYLSVDGPEWLTIVGWQAGTSNEQVAVSVESLGGGRARTTLHSKRWTAYNNYVALYMAFNSSYVGSVDTLCVGLHTLPSSPSACTNVTTHFAALPNVPLPSSLITSVTWTSADLLLDGAVGGHTFSFLDTYKRLGFNTVPLVSVPGCIAHRDTTCPPVQASWLSPDNRTSSPQWDGLRFGPEVSGFHNIYSTMLHTPPSASFLASLNVSTADIPLELTKWKNAVAFHNTTHEVDIGYDGVFFRLDVQEHVDVVTLLQPDVLFADDEGWGEGWHQWQHTVVQSANAQARRLPGESDLNLAWRMVREMLTSWSSAVYAASPSTTIGEFS